jgi:methylthioribose-1-phosphate isomerase
MIKTLEWKGGKLRILDQTQLPGKVSYIQSRDFKDTAEAIRRMKVRGAPAIGVAAAFGLAQVVAKSKATKVDQLSREMDRAAGVLQATRPTAVNLAWGLQRMRGALETYRDRRMPKLKELLIAEAVKIQKDDVAVNEAIGRHGAGLLREGDRVLTHCNTGALATAGHGTALGVIRSAAQEKKKLSVWVDETRPYLQGARLTTFELREARIPHTLITDSTAAALMARRQVDVVLVGADRIAANGDVANKIGTYGLAVLAYENKIPFYVAAPLSSIDLKLASGQEIPIEERPAEEVTTLAGRPIAPKGTRALHLGFDITPHRYISALITEAGVVRAPYQEGLQGLMAASGHRDLSGS